MEVGLCWSSMSSVGACLAGCGVRTACAHPTGTLRDKQHGYPLEGRTHEHEAHGTFGTSLDLWPTAEAARSPEAFAVGTLDHKASASGWNERFFRLSV